MLVTGIYAGLAYTAGHAFAPAVSTPYQVTPALSAWPAVASRVRMSAAGGTETVDIELGKIVNDREVLDSDLLKVGRRSRWGLDWSTLRSRLETEFGMSDATLKKYDDISKEDLTKSCVRTLVHVAAWPA